MLWERCKVFVGSTTPGLFNWQTAILYSLRLMLPGTPMLHGDWTYVIHESRGWDQCLILVTAR